MVIFKYIPNILKDEGRVTKELPFIVNKTIKEYLDETGFDYKEANVIVSGIKVDDYNSTIKNNDEVTVTPKVGAFLAIFGPFWGAVGGWLSAIIAVASIAYSIYAMCNQPKAPTFNTSGDGLDEGSPTYGWDGVVNTQDVGTPIGVVYGEHRVGGNIINQYIRTDGDLEYLNLLIALSEGEIESIDNIEINENPSSNFNNIVLTKRYGTNSQVQINPFNDSHDLKPLSVFLTKNNDYIYTTVNTDITAFEVKLTCVGGLYQASGASISSWDVTYDVQYSIHDENDWTDCGSTTISGKSRTDLRRVFRQDGITAGQYDIKITKTSDDSSLDPMKQGDLYLKGIDEIVHYEPLVYPNVALLGVEALATDQLNGATPTITSLVKGRKVNVPDIRLDEGGSTVAWDDYYYDPIDGSACFRLFSDDSALYWDNTTYVPAYSANPIWCLRDLITNTRYGLGDYITSTNMDVTNLLEMAKYCEEKVSDGDGGYEKRFRLDVVIDSSTKALDLLSQLSASFRCFTFYSNGTVNLKIDKEEEPVQLFGMGNIISESFIQSWKSIKDTPNVIEVQFMNKDLNYKQDIVSIMNEISITAGDPIRKKSLRLFCTRISQAIREGQYALNIGNAIQRTVILRASIDAIACQAGDVINVAHDVPVWGVASGRVQTGSTTSLVKLDTDVEIENGKTYKIMIREYNDVIEERYISNSAGNYTEVSVTVPFTNDLFAYDVYSLGEETKTVAPYRIVGMKRAENSEVEITALEYDVDVYDTDTIALPDNNYSALTMTVPSVDNLILTERLVKMEDGTIENCIDVWFNKPEYINGISMLQYNKAKIFISDNGGNSYIYKGETTGTHFQIIGDLIDAVSYKIAVVSVGFNDKTNAIANSPTSTIQLIGKSAPPSDVTSFLVSQNRNILYLGWSNVDDVDLSGYEIRVGVSWDVGNVLASNIKLNNYLSLDFKVGSAQSYWIKAIDTSGNYSENATEGLITVDNIPFTNIIQSFSDQTAWGGTKTNVSKVGDNLEIDATYLTGTYVTAIRNVGYVATFKIGINTVVVVAGDDTWEDFGQQTFAQIPATLRFTGSEIIGVTSFEIKTSEDNATWSEWTVWQSGDYVCRYFQIRMTITRSSTAQELQVSELNYYADLPDIDEFDTGEVTDVDTGLAVTFTNTFHEIPSVNIDILTGDANYHRFEVAPDTTGFTVKLFDGVGTSKLGTFRYHAHGV